MSNVCVCLKMRDPNNPPRCLVSFWWEIRGALDLRPKMTNDGFPWCMQWDPFGCVKWQWRGHDGDNELRNEAFYLAIILEGHSRFRCNNQLISTISAPDSIDILDFKKTDLEQIDICWLKNPSWFIGPNPAKKYQRVVAPDGLWVWIMVCHIMFKINSEQIFLVYNLDKFWRLSTLNETSQLGGNLFHQNTLWHEAFEMVILMGSSLKLVLALPESWQGQSLAKTGWCCFWQKWGRTRRRQRRQRRQQQRQQQQQQQQPQPQRQRQQRQDNSSRYEGINKIA